MLTLDKIPFGPYEQYRLQSADGQTALHIVPAAGANASQVVLHGQPILDGFETPEALAAAKGGKSAVLFPFPNRLQDGAYTWNGQTHHFPINSPATTNAIHGFVRHEAFEVDQVVLTNHYAAIHCTYHYSGKFDYFPFPFQLDLVFSVYTRGVFRLQASVRNLNHFDIPVGLGWHPYFKLADSTDEHHLTLPQAALIDIDERMLPTGIRTPYADFAAPTPLGDTRFDNCFAYTGNEHSYAIALAGTAGQLQLDLEAESFPFFQLYTPDGRESIAVEPMSCNINALQNHEGLVHLAPNGTWQATIQATFYPSTNRLKTNRLKD